MKRGFTLIELLLVLAILGGLAAILLPTVVGWGKSSKQTVAEGNVHTIRVAVESYYLDKSVLPYDDDCSNGDKDGNGIAEWLDDLAKTDNTILTNIKADPWDNDYYYDTENGSGPTDPARKYFIVLSRGPNGTTTYDASSDPLNGGILDSSSEVDSDDIYDTNAQVK
ncbi:MAG: hypothetical protein DRP82_04740 [Planctomycetota bacterium]|nr:MAG: hypothetical protein DRP82_04740 [Planctomycetota bacterium]